MDFERVFLYFETRILTYITLPYHNHPYRTPTVYPSRSSVHSLPLLSLAPSLLSFHHSYPQPVLSPVVRDTQEQRRDITNYKEIFAGNVVSLGVHAFLLLTFSLTIQRSLAFPAYLPPSPASILYPCPCPLLFQNLLAHPESFN